MVWFAQSVAKEVLERLQKEVKERFIVAFYSRLLPATSQKRTKNWGYLNDEGGDKDAYIVVKTLQLLKVGFGNGFEK